MYRDQDKDGNPKYLTRSKAKVIDNRDPLKRGRVRIEHPFTGKTSWCDYLRSPGNFSVPSIGDLVYIEADTGEIEYIVAWGNATKGLDESANIPEEFKRDIPTNRGFYTPGGHLIEFDDGEATLSNSPTDTNFTTTKRGIRITSSGDNKIHIVEDAAASQKYILIQDAGGNMIKLDYQNNQLTINSIGNTNDTTAGNKTETVGGDFTVNVSGNVNVTAGGNAVVMASQIHLNGSASGITTENSHMGVIDLITGVPVQASTTVKSDV